MFYTYIVECADGTYYVGSTTDLDRRVNEHNTAVVGARYTKARRPVVLKYSESFLTWSEALKREAVIKKYKRAEKRALCATHSNTV